MLSLIDRIEAVAERPHGNVTFISGDDHTTIGWDDLHREARGAAAALQALGVRPGDHVGLIGPTTRRLVTTIQATWLCGAARHHALPMRMGALNSSSSGPAGASTAPTPRLVVIDPTSRRSSSRRRATTPFVTLDSCSGAAPATPAANRQRPGARGAAVHLGLHLRAEA